MYLSLQEVLRPTRLEACLEALIDEETAILGGGTLLNAVCPTHVVRLVDLQALPLRAVERAGDGWRIGALVRLSGLVDGDLPAGFAALVEAARDERNLPIRNQSTVGGRIARRRGDARLPTALLALDATLEIAALGDDGVQVDGLHLADFASHDLAGAIIASAVLPASTSMSGYRSFSMTAVDAPVADAALARTASGWRIASGGHGDSGVHALAQAAAMLDNASAQADGSWRQGLREAVLDTLPAHGDSRASGDYRRAVAATLIVRLADDLLGQGGAA